MLYKKGGNARNRRTATLLLVAASQVLSLHGPQAGVLLKLIRPSMDQAE